ncbi:protein kinase domain-containing protein [Phytohabitans kaempferiae]|uniref:non-specific serine/threonine protein kinase n=1 Tax=Phytohabitans kaempferiae TaxID=1620943 RepID=A0ABV6MBX0_9ACTN
MGETQQVLNGRYRLIEWLGSGGMSVVWRAHDEILDRYVAVKVLATGHTDGLWPPERFRQEARAAARLSHPHVTAVHDYGESTDGSGERVPYVVMELLTGQTLAQRMASGAVPPGEALRITAEVATAVATAHVHALVHCDIKPANVMLTPTGVKVLDFGIAAAAGNRGGPGDDGVVVGTPAYLAPERFTRGEVSPAADVYALGLVLYRLLAGVPPWPAQSIVDRLAAHATLPPEPLPATVPVSAEVAATCLRCLAKEPAERPTAHELAVILGAAGGWRVVPAADGGVVLAKGLAPRPAVGQVRRRLRTARTLPMTVASHRAPTGPGRRRAGNAWGRRATRFTAAAVLAMMGLVAGWGLPDGMGHRQRPEAVETAPAVPPPDRGAGTGAAPPIEEPGGTTGEAPRTTAALRGPIGGGAAANLGSEAGRDAPSGGGQRPGGGTESPAPPERTPPPAPGPDPEPAPEPRSPSTAPVEQLKTLVTAGGTVVVRCVGSTASIVSVSPLASFGILDVDRGPGAEVGVVLKALLLTVRVTVTCASGLPKASIQVS